MTEQEQRAAFQELLEDAGVPDVIAFMAATRMVVDEEGPCLESASEGLWSNFVWADTPEGGYFWLGVVLLVCDMEKAQK